MELFPHLNCTTLLPAFCFHSTQQINGLFTCQKDRRPSWLFYHVNVTPSVQQLTSIFQTVNYPNSPSKLLTCSVTSSLENMGDVSSPMVQTSCGQSLEPSGGSILVFLFFHVEMGVFFWINHHSAVDYVASGSHRRLFADSVLFGIVPFVVFQTVHAHESHAGIPIT